MDGSRPELPAAAPHGAPPRGPFRVYVYDLPPLVLRGGHLTLALTLTLTLTLALTLALTLTLSLALALTLSLTLALTLSLTLALTLTTDH